MDAGLDHDLIIIGGGLAGASLALALKDLPLSIALIEAVAYDAAVQPAFDARAIALAAGSQRILHDMGLWDSIAARGATAIENIHIGEQGGFASARLSAEEAQLAALGQVVEAHVLGASIAEALAQADRIELISPAEFIALNQDATGVDIELRQGGRTRRRRSRLVIAADGGHSAVRDALGGATWGWNYGQSAVIATLSADRPHRHWAYERFTRTGPLALLPCDPPTGSEIQLHGHRWSLVWTVRTAQAEPLLALDDAEFLQALQPAFGYRAGRFLRVGARSAYPLALRFVRKAVHGRVAFIGNAAHTLHPVAGQGFNLGLRDVAALAKTLAAALAQDLDIGSADVLKTYARWRRPDYLRTALFTDGLIRSFSNNQPPLRLARNLGLLALNALPFARRSLARQAMGLGRSQQHGL